MTALEDCTSALSLLWDDVDVRAYQVFRTLCDSAATTLRARLKVLHNKEPQKQKWLYYLYSLEDHLGNYGRAANYYFKEYQLSPTAQSALNLADKLASLNLHDAALMWQARAENHDSKNIDAPLLAAVLHMKKGNFNEANAALERAIALDAENPDIYKNYGQLNSERENPESALEAYDMALSLSADDTKIFNQRGRLLLKMGQKERAAKDFQRILDLEQTYVYRPYTPFALYFLGQPKAALARMDSIMAKGDDEQAYNAACIYALCGNKQQALTYLERALKSRKYTDFDHIDKDSDLDNLRDDADFKALVKQYRDAWEAHLAAERKLLDPRITEKQKSNSTTVK